MNGWIKLHRKCLEWEWFNSEDTVRLFLYLLLTELFQSILKHINMRRDPYTGNEFEPKRSNQKFSCRLSRILYNNMMARARRKNPEFFYKPLDRNRFILSRLLGNNKEKLYSREFLLEKGFNFRFYSYSKRVNNVMTWFVYEFALVKGGNDNYKIFRYK